MPDNKRRIIKIFYPHITKSKKISELIVNEDVVRDNKKTKNESTICNKCDVSFTFNHLFYKCENNLRHLNK